MSDVPSTNGYREAYCRKEATLEDCVGGHCYTARSEEVVTYVVAAPRHSVEVRCRLVCVGTHLGMSGNNECTVSTYTQRPVGLASRTGMKRQRTSIVVTFFGRNPSMADGEFAADSSLPAE